MRKLLSTAILQTCIFLSAFSQCLPAGIFTRPDSAINLQRPSMTNYFDWMKQKYKKNTLSSYTGNDSIDAPIYQPDNEIIDHIRLARKTNLSIYIVDALGRKIKIISNNKSYPAGFSNVHINAEKLPDGIYNVIMENGQNRVVKKLVVQR